jgi:hypothetical protein
MLEKQLKHYGLRSKDIISMDLQSCYMQARPNKPLDNILKNENGVVDYSMLASPHTEIAKIYYEKGEKHLRKVYNETRYGVFRRKYMGKKDFPQRIIGLFNSIKKGYRRKGHKDHYIVILMKPFAKSRYNRDIPDLVPEIWSGHHRAGAMIALGKDIVEVLIAVDANPGTNYSAGKIHDLCK